MTSPTTPGRTPPPGDGPIGNGQAPVARPAVSLRRAAYRPLSWRNPWTMLLGVLAAFQAGVITTLLWTSGQSTGAREAATAETSATAATSATSATTATAGVTQAAPAAAATASQTTATPPAGATATAPPAATATATPERAASRRDRDRAGASSRVAKDRDAPASTSVTPPAEPAAGEGGLVEIEIRSEPEGATVKIAGAVWGVTPLTAYLPVTAPVEIKLELDGYAPTKLRWSPSSGKRVLGTALKPLETP